MTPQQPTVAMSPGPVARRRADPLLPEWLQGAAAVGWRALVVVAFGAVIAQVAFARTRPRRRLRASPVARETPGIHQARGRGLILAPDT